MSFSSKCCEANWNGDGINELDWFSWDNLRWKPLSSSPSARDGAPKIVFGLRYVCGWILWFKVDVTIVIHGVYKPTNINMTNKPSCISFNVALEVSQIWMVQMVSYPHPPGLQVFKQVCLLRSPSKLHGKLWRKSLSNQKNSLTMGIYEIASKKVKKSPLLGPCCLWNEKKP